MLRTLPYLDGYVEAVSSELVPIYDASKALEGYNLYVSGHAPEVRLIDMGGKTLHVWRRDFLDIWPQYRFFRRDASLDNPPHYFFRSHLYDNGDVLALFEGHGLVKLDKNSKLIWKYEGSKHREAL